MDEITILGKTNYRNTKQVFGIKDKDRLQHIYCLGKTGVGKSTLLLNMAISDIEKGNGVGIIDPHGDIAEAILNYIPKERINDVIYFNACDTEFPIAFNPLYHIHPSQHYLVASSLVNTFKKIWIDSWGPRLEHILRYSLLTLLCYPHATLLDIQPLLTNSSFRNHVLLYVTDTAIIEFWQKEFEVFAPQFRNEMISPIINKVGLFQTHTHLRNITGQNISSFRIGDVMDSHKIFIANLSKGVLGEEGSQLLGSMLVTQFQTASLERALVPESTRTPFYLYIDEMHSFVTQSFADILSESRKYGLSLFLTHQYIEQLNEKIRDAIIGNVGTFIFFRIGITDAIFLKEEFAPVLSTEDVVQLPQFSVYIKLLIDGSTSVPFSATTLPLKKETLQYKSEIIINSREYYAHTKEEVLKAIERRRVLSKEKEKQLKLL